MWFKFSFYAVLVMCALLFGLLVYFGIECPIVLISIVVVTAICVRYHLKKAELLSPDEEIYFDKK